MMHPLLKDLTGQAFGRLTVVSFAGSVKGRTTWHCSCACGGTRTAVGSDLKNGRTMSCGCLQAQVRSSSHTRHGGRDWPEWRVWQSMIRRCHSPKATSFSYYGGRGIAVCDRWRQGADGLHGFECFIADMGRRPSGGLTLDRINNDGNYEPGNVRWATRREQQHNKRAWGTARAANEGGSCENVEAAA